MGSFLQEFISKGLESFPLKPTHEQPLPQGYNNKGALYTWIFSRAKNGAGYPGGLASIELWPQLLEVYRYLGWDSWTQDYVHSMADLKHELVELWLQMGPMPEVKMQRPNVGIDYTGKK